MKFCYKSIALFFCLSAPAAANNFYVGLNLGLNDQSGKFSVVDDTLDPTVGINDVLEYQAPDDSALSTSLFVGYKLARDLFLEVGYASNDDLDGDVRQTTNTSAIDVFETSSTSYYYAAFVGIWPIDNNWAFNARLGFSVWKLNYSQTEVDTSVLPSDQSYVLNEQFFNDNTSAMLLGIGGSYGLNQNIEFKISLDSHLVDFAFTNLELDYDSTTLTVGAVYHF